MKKVIVEISGGVATAVRFEGDGPEVEVAIWDWDSNCECCDKSGGPANVDTYKG